jgi:hypothetical protein
MRRGERSGIAVLYGVLAAFGVLVCAFALWRGYVFVVKK